MINAEHCCLIISKVVLNGDISAALPSQLCGSILATIRNKFCSTQHNICALFIIKSFCAK